MTPLSFHYFKNTGTINIIPMQLKTYGYDSDKFGVNGNIPSGSKGSGVVPVTLSLMIAMTLIWLTKLFTHGSKKKDDENLKGE